MSQTCHGFLLLAVKLLYLRAMKILMVCLGNICRSPLAEGILKEKARKAGLDWIIESAGTNGYHNGEAPHQLSQKVARLNGIDISEQRSRKMTSSDIETYDLIYALAPDVMTDIQKITRNSFDPKKVRLIMEEQFPGANLEVPDPWYGPEPGYHEVYQLLNEVCDVIIKKYS